MGVQLSFESCSVIGWNACNSMKSLQLYRPSWPWWVVIEMWWFSSVVSTITHDSILAHDYHGELTMINTLRPRQNGRYFADDIFKCIFLNENVWIPIWISLKFVPKGPINNIPALVQIMAWRRPGNKPLSEPMMVSSPTHIYVTRPQWVKSRVVIKIINSLWLSDAYKCVSKFCHHWVQIITCRLFSAKPLHESMLTYCQLDPEEYISMKLYLKFESFHWQKCVSKCLQNGSHFVWAVGSRWANPDEFFSPSHQHGWYWLYLMSYWVMFIYLTMSHE